MNYETQRTWADKFTPEAMRIIQANSHLLPAPRISSNITVSDEMRDMKQATDAVILQTGEICVALRIRRFKHLSFYKNEFTLRIKCRGDNPTELEKIKSGFCQVYFYGFANADDSGIAYWRIIDMQKFRKWMRNMEAKGINKPYSVIDNRDGTMGAAFRIRESLLDCVIIDSNTKETNQLSLF